MLDLVLEAGHLENPFLSGNRFERRFTAEDEYDVACCDEDQFGEGFFDTGQEFAKGTDALANSLDRDPGFDESDGGLQCNEIFERVAVVAPRSSRRRLYQVGLRPVLELPSRNAEDLNDIATAEVFDRASHRRQGVRSSYFRGRCQSACGGGEGHWGGSFSRSHCNGSTEANAARARKSSRKRECFVRILPCGLDCVYFPPFSPFPGLVESRWTRGGAAPGRRGDAIGCVSCRV